jgi:hypothetical protein
MLLADLHVELAVLTVLAMLLVDLHTRLVVPAVPTVFFEVII